VTRAGGDPVVRAGGAGDGGGMGKITQRKEDFGRSTVYSETPPIPRQVLVEVANVCNHSCVFCAYSKMTREKGTLALPDFTRIMQEAWDAGAREAGLYSGAEPLLVSNIAEYIAACKAIGYEYVYISTNGSAATRERIEEIMDAGLDSLKFSINGGTREAYLKVHGRDHFDRVLANVRYAHEYRVATGVPMYLAASFVECDENRGTFENLKNLIGGVVDEVVFVRAGNQSGQMLDYPPNLPPKTICSLPFNRLNISREGYMRACCNDYQNLLAVDDVTATSVAAAWHGERMKDLRRRHLSGQGLEELLCHNCIHGTNVTVKAFNPTLSTLPQIR
jgi:pyruvate-formate lyase-activating enzyme